MKNFYINKFTILIGVFVIVFMAACIYIIKIQTTPNVPANNNVNGDNKIIFPKPIFDATAKLAKSGIIIEYPKNGFYDMGARLDFAKRGLNDQERLEIIPTQESNANKTSEYVRLSIRVEKILQGETLQTIVSSFPSDSLYVGSAIKNRFININDKLFYIGKITGEDHSNGWFGLTVKNDQVIWVVVGYQSSGIDSSLESLAAYNNNDKLFLQILEHIKF